MPRAAKRSPKQRSPSLTAYDEKRDFASTPEPGPRTPTAGEGPLTFVVQKHAARRLHYDFRLELDGVLKSWAVPKGPSLDPAEKRLATMVEDHPLDYGPFEGVIPKGEYGAGQVIVWDNGSYAPDEERFSFRDRIDAEARMRQGIEQGKLSFTLRGCKLKGSWTLVKIQRSEKDWLLIKHRDAYATSEREVLDDDRSVLSGLSIADLKAGRLPDRAQRALPPLTPAGARGARRAPFPASLAPMLAGSVERPFSDPAWYFEPKLDGVRTLVLLRDGAITLLSRSGIDATAQYPLLAQELALQPAEELVLDGEIVAPDEEGRPSFELLQQRLNLTRETDIRRAEAQVPVLFYAFDLLTLDGYDLCAAPLEQRRALLERLLLPTERVLLLEQFDAQGEAAYAAALEHGLEGIVAKRRDSVYEPGKRSRHWLKIKGTQSDEFVVGGYTQGAGSRAETFGALLLGRYDERGSLVFSGHVGSGFDDRALRDIRKRLDALTTTKSSFAEVPQLNAPATWVRPQLVAEVKFAQRTRDGLLRAPVFLRLRDDKPAANVTLMSDRGADDDPPPSDGDEIAAVLDQLKTKRDKLQLRVQGHKIAVSNLDKELWPGLGRKRALTKRDLLVYFAQVSPYLLPHLRDRPLTLTRYPNGIAGKHFYQKHWDAPLPDFVDTVRLYSSHNEGDQEYLICNNLPSLLWLGQIADLELHTWYSRVDPEPDGHHLSRTFTGSRKQIEASLLNYPDFIVFDLDPYRYSGHEVAGEEPELNKKAFAMTCQVARWLKDVLDTLSLSSFVKTSGKTGLHIYVPILRQLGYDAVRAACETIGRFVLQQHPRDVTMEWAVEKRTGKVFFDHNQNARGKTLASIYSPRPLPGAPVSTPLRWDQLEEVYPTDFTIRTLPDRLAQTGDLWADILDAKHDLQGLLAGAGSPDAGGKRSRKR